MMHCPESTNKQCINYNLTECTQWVQPMFEDILVLMDAKPNRIANVKKKNKLEVKGVF